METPIDDLLKKRYRKFRAIGNFEEEKSSTSSSRS